MLDQLFVNFDGVDFTARFDRPRELEGKDAAAGPDVRHRLAGLEPKLGKEISDLRPCTLVGVERGDPFIGWAACELRGQGNGEPA